MAGKKKIDGAMSHRPGWGGARPGSGKRRLTELADWEIRALFKAVKKRAKIEKRKWHDVLLDVIYGATVTADGERVEIEVATRDRIAAIKLLADMTLGRRDEKRITLERVEPVIGLPPVREDPVKVIPMAVAKNE